ncbi:uncharacterized protein PG998_005265 [Apiospora kogelbergensis]|uniref:uncharacterized protein n=1 Tax=Apiospora kogelbergensis TaxID=1337665 RepID=UPI003130F5A5
MSQTPEQTSRSEETALRIWRRACVACTKTKRQCTKQVPSCRRCSVRGIPCAYPPPRDAAQSQVQSHPSSANDTSPMLSDDPDAPRIAEQLAASATAPPNLEDLDSSDFQPQSTSYGTAITNTLTNTGASGVDWFLAPNSFVSEITVTDTLLRDIQVDTSVDQMHHLIDLVKKWLKQWATGGHSSLFHRQLYRAHMPRCVQDAYSAMALYFVARNPANQDSIFHLLDDRVTQLLEDQMSAELLPAGLDPGSQARELFGKLSRVQSLLAYQTVRLFDGDIRMRARAEAVIPTLSAWTKDLWAQTRRSASPAPGWDASTPTSPLRQSLPFDGLITLNESVVTWKLWILVESIRRTWLISKLVIEIYHYLKHGWSQCPGVIPMTLSAELWSAETAYAWSCAQKQPEHDGCGALFVPLHQQLDMMQSTDPGKVDELGRVVLGLIWGLERMAKWNNRMGGSNGTSNAERPVR